MKSEPIASNTLRGSVELVIDAFDILRDVRHNLALSFINQLQQSVGTNGPFAEWAQVNLDLIDTVVKRQQALENELAQKIKEAITGVEDIAIPPVSPQAPRHTPSAHHDGVHITVRQNQGPVAVPIKLHNHLGALEIITLNATPFQEVGGTRVLAGRIRFEPQRMELTGGASAQAHAVIYVSPEFQQGKEYVAEIRIGGSNPQSLPLRCTVLSGEPVTGRSKKPEDAARETSQSIPASVEVRPMLPPNASEEVEIPDDEGSL